MVKHSFDCLLSFPEPPEIHTVEGLSAVVVVIQCEHHLCSQTTRAPSCATPGYLLNFSQLWDKLWSKRFLTDFLIFINARNLHEYRGFEAFYFSGLKRPTRSQTTRATNCATPGYIYILVCFLLINFLILIRGASLRNIVA